MNNLVTPMSNVPYYDVQQIAATNIYIIDQNLNYYLQTASCACDKVTCLKGNTGTTIISEYKINR